MPKLNYIWLKIKYRTIPINSLLLMNYPSVEISQPTNASHKKIWTQMQTKPHSYAIRTILKAWVT